MLKTFSDLVIQLDFDIFYAWNGEAFDYKYIFNRMKNLKIKPIDLSPINIIDKRSNYPKGRAWLDLMKAHRKLSTQELESYALNAVGEAELGIGKVYHEEHIGEMWEHNIDKFVKYNLKDVYIMVKIDAKKGITSYFDTIRRTTFCNWDDLLWNSRVLDYYALKYAHKSKIVLPDKNKGSNEDESIQGARVLTPIVGIHSGCAVVDVRSLYPSAILTCNMSPETIINENYAIDNDIEYCKVDDICFRMDIRGFIPSMIEEMWDLRQSYKNKRDNYEIGSDLYNKYDIMQTVAKMNLNSIYGVLLLKVFRLYNRNVGKSVTYFGREYNKFMERYIINSGHKPIYGDSVTKGTKIDVVGKGQIDIDELFTQVDFIDGDKEYCNLCDIYTPTIDVDGKYVNKRVPYIMRHKTDKKIYRIRNYNNTYVEITEDHNLIMIKKGRWSHKANYTSNFECKSPNENLNEYMMVYQKTFCDIEKEDDDKLPIEVYQLIGLMLGDGNIPKTGHSLRLSYGLDKDDIINNYILPLIDLGWIDRYNCVESNMSLNFYGKFVYFFRENFETENGFKYMNLEFVFNKPEIKKCALIRGLFDSDGCVGIDGNYRPITFSNNNLNMCKQLVQLFKTIGIASTCRTENRKFNSIGNEMVNKSNIVSVMSKFDYKNKIGFLIKRKNDRLMDISHNGKNHVNEIVKVPITSIEQIEYDDYVYDIEVEDTHTFFANNILVKNTDSCCFKLHKSTYRERINEANGITTELNQLSDRWCEETWGSCKYNKIWLELESIYRKLITLPSRQGTEAKKRYASLVYYKDGKDLRKDPELCIKGINAKRSDSPEVFRNLQKNIFKMVLEGRENEAKGLIKQLYFDITTEKYTPEELGIPKGLGKNVSEYDDPLPIHVRASLYANQFCNENIKRDKIKYIYVHENIRPKGNPPTNVIAFTEKFPEGYKVDVVTMAEKLLIYQYDTLFQVMGWNIDELKGQVSLIAFM
jgi:DNA polymerase elongation subunit (family B)